MKLPPQVTQRIRQSIDASMAREPEGRGFCIHFADRLIGAIEDYFENRPEEARQAAISFFRGDRHTLSRTMELITESSITEEECGDVLCLHCRRERVMGRVIRSDDPRPEDLQAVARYLGDDAMQSLKWLSKILKGTITSPRSSPNHKEEAERCLEKTIPLLTLNVAIIESLQQDLKEAVEARDKYHSLADMLMDEQLSPASSE